MSDNQTNNYYAPLYPPEARPNIVLPNAPNNQPEHDLHAVYQKLSESIKVVSSVIAANPKIAPDKIGAVNEQLAEIFSSVNDMGAAHKRFEYSQKILKRELNGYDCDASSVNNSGKIYGSYAELAANNAE